ncbi:hypothetical protein RB594_002929 [Gaeumannomyces avenae]
MPNDPTMLEYSPDCYCCRIDTWLSNCAAADNECAAADDAALDHEQKSRTIMPVTPPLSSARRSISPSKRRRIEADDNADEDHPLPPDGDPTPRPGPSMSEQRSFVILPPPDQPSIPVSHSHDQSRGARTKSTGSGFSPRKQRSTSPVKKPQHMRALSKPIEMRALSNPKHQLPPDMVNLYRRIQGIVEFHNAFVPAEAQEAITGALQESGDLVTSWPGNWFFSSPEGTTDSGSQDRRAAAEAELAALLKLKATADECQNESVSEAAWNMDVHSPILQLATAGSGVRRLLITTARITPVWLATVGPTSLVPGTASTPSISSSTASSVGRPHLATEGAGANAAVAGGKMVDFALVLSESEETPLGSAILNAIRAVALDEQSVNQSTYMPLTLRPLGVSIETKVSTSTAEGRVQLGLWTAAWFARMQEWISIKPAAKGIPTAMPVILVFEHRWELSFVCDRGVKFEFIGEVLIGDTRSLVGLYKLLAVLRVLVQWMDTDLRAFFEDLFDV